MHIEPLENRIAPATHEWLGLGADSLWSNPLNWTNGSPQDDASGNIDLIFHSNLLSPDRLVMENDIAGLVVDSITFDANAAPNAAGGVSSAGYTFNGNPIIIRTGAAGEDPFGIVIASGTADAGNEFIQTFNLDLALSTDDATFRIQQLGARIVINGDVDLGGRVLTLNTISDFSGIGIAIHGEISNGNLVKTDSGRVQLTGDNRFTNLTVNSGVIFADSDTALGASSGVVTVNDPGQIKLRNGVTVEKTTLNLNSNTSGGGLGADGNTANTFRGSVVLMAGVGGVALGAGLGIQNANTRLVIDGVVSGATSTLFLNGAGVIEFAQSNTFTGITQINGNQGFTALQLNSPGGLGASGDANRTIINNGGGGTNGGAIWLNFNGTIAEDIDFAGGGVGGFGAIRALGEHDAVLTGNITFIAASPWRIGADAGTLTLTGIIDSQGANRALTKVGEGTLVIGGTAGNVYSGGTIVEAGVLRVQNTSAAPLGSLASTVIVNSGGTLSVEAGVTLLNPAQINAGGTLAGGGAAGSIASTGGTIAPNGRVTTGNLLLDGASTFLADVSGPSIGALRDQVRVNGAVTLGGATLALAGGFAATPGAEFVIIDNDSNDAVIGTFAGLSEGSRIAAGGHLFNITYAGGDGNDVALVAIAPQSSLAIAANGRSATYTDIDGDLVTVRITKGTLDAADFTFGFADDNRQHLQRLVLDADDAGASLIITAKRSATGGDGFANVGHIQATGVTLAAVRVDGDLGRIDADAVKTIAVQSLGALGLTSQSAGGNLVSNLNGNVGKITVKASIHGATLLASGNIGAIAVLGSFLGGRLSAGAELGVVSVRGDIAGTENSPVVISSFGKATAPAAGKDIALKSLRVSGGVEHMRVLAGYDLSLTGLNADASIGSIIVNADWRSSSILAGAEAGADGFIGTADDATLTTGGVRDTATIFSSIASITIKGQAFGSTGAGDHFGIVAELVGRAKVGKAALKFDRGERDAVDAFAISSTGPGAAGLASDFFIREVTV